jgi:hypothetical protein
LIHSKVIPYTGRTGPEHPGCLHREEVSIASMKKEEARRAVLNEYDRWAKKHPNKASMMGGFLFFRYLQDERSDLLAVVSRSAPLPAPSGMIVCTDPLPNDHVPMRVARFWSCSAPATISEADAEPPFGSFVSG